MTVKRSRIARSMSFGQLGGAINQSAALLWSPAISADAKPVSGSVKASKRSPVKPILTVSSSPESETERELGQGYFGNFLGKCYYCQKKMPQDAEIYMYGCMHGFCSLECRFRQMIFDKVEEISQNSTTTKAKDQSGSQLQNRAPYNLKTVS